jgi:mannose-6-phosphate isomerase-like protein (cupin superfamily)
MIPAGTWHNIINTGNKPLKLYSIYAPPEHPRGTVHVTKADSEAEEKKKK